MRKIVATPSTAEAAPPKWSGVQHVWLVDPRAKSVEVLRPNVGSYRLVSVHGDADVARLEPFDAIELSLSALWPTRASAP